MATSSVQKMASDLAVDIIQYSCGIIITPKDECTLIMRRCVDKMLTNYQYKFNGLIKLVVNDHDDTDIVVVFREVVKHMLKEPAVNWGHIVSIYAFTARITQHLMAQNSPQNKDTIIETMTEVWSSAFSHELENWITEHEGFDSFVQAFGNCNSPENSIFKGLFTAIVTLGLCALAVKVFHE